MADIHIIGLTKRFGEVTAVDNISLQISGGEFLTLLGPSGCGKTTTLRMVAGLELPDDGHIMLNDREVTHVPANRRGFGMVFQNYALFPHMTIFENVAFGLRARREPRDVIARKVEEALALVRLDGYAQRKPSQLSGGQQQRVALARALAAQPSVLLLDEPLSNLDAQLREETRTEIQRLQKDSGITTIYVTHDQAEALALSDRVAVMNNGRFEQIGTPAEIYGRPASSFVARFIGQVNVFDGSIVTIENGQAFVDIGFTRLWSSLDAAAQHDGATQKAEHGQRPLNEPIRAGQSVQVCIHPENLNMASAESTNMMEVEVDIAQFNGVTTIMRFNTEDDNSLHAVVLSRSQIAGLQRGTKTQLTVSPEDVLLLDPR